MSIPGPALSLRERPTVATKLQPQPAGEPAHRQRDRDEGGGPADPPAHAGYLYWTQVGVMAEASYLAPKRPSSAWLMVCSITKGQTLIFFVHNGTTTAVPGIGPHIMPKSQNYYDI